MVGWFFGPGGSLYFAIDAKGHSYPRVSVGDNSREKLIKLKNILGGTVSGGGSRGESQHLWTLGQSSLVVCLAEHMQQFVPSWQETIWAFLSWAETDSMEDRLEIAQMANGEEDNNFTINDYLPLVRDVEFLAGVFDSRGMLKDRLLVRSKNGSLLAALQFVYGGFHDVTVEKGTVWAGRERGVIYTSSSESYEWRVTAETHREFKHQLDGHLKLLQF